MDVTNPHNDEIITTLMHFLELRIQKRNILRADLRQKRNIFDQLFLSSKVLSKISYEIDLFRN